MNVLYYKKEKYWVSQNKVSNLHGVNAANGTAVFGNAVTIEPFSEADRVFRIRGF